MREGKREGGIKEYGAAPRRAAPAQTAMKLPSSCFYCLSVLRSERTRKEGEGTAVRGRSGLSRYGQTEGTPRSSAVGPTGDAIGETKKAKGNKVFSDELLLHLRNLFGICAAAN